MVVRKILLSLMLFMPSLYCEAEILHKMLEYSYIYTFYRIFRFDVK